MTIKILRFSLFMILSLHIGSKSFAQVGTSGVGNGGDGVRDAFFSIAFNILEIYKVPISNLEIHTQEIIENLTLGRVKNVSTVLVDNSGSKVSSLGEPGSIQLYVGNDLPDLNWAHVLLDPFESERQVLHEMLRSIGYPDDKFVATNKILEQQGRLTEAEAKFNFLWAKNIQALILSALHSDFQARTLDEALSAFRDSKDLIFKKNQLPYPSLMGPTLRLLTKLDQFELNEKESKNGNEKYDMVQLYRNSFRNLAKLNEVIDQLPLKPSLFPNYLSESLSLISNAYSWFRDLEPKFFVSFVNELQEISKIKKYNPSLEFLPNQLSELSNLLAYGQPERRIVERKIIAIRQAGLSVNQAIVNK